MNWAKQENIDMLREGQSFWIRFLTLVIMGIIVSFFWWIVFTPDFFEEEYRT